MKRFLFSTYTKVFAVILFLASLTLGCLAGIQGGQQLWEEDNYIYDFGSSLEDSYYFRHLVDLPENSVLGAFWEFTYRGGSFRDDLDIMDETQDPLTDVGEPTEEPFPTAPQKKPLSRDEEAQLLHRIEEMLDNLPYLDYIEYYVNLNGTVFSNNGVSDPATLTDGLYKYFTIDKDGNTEFSCGRNSYDMPWIYDSGIENLQVDPLIIATRIRPEYVEECSVLWKEQETILYTMGARLLIFALILLLSLIYLICVCGKDKDGNRKESWVDRIWAEFHLAAIATFGIGAIFLCVVVIDATFNKQFPIEAAYLISGVVIPLAGGLILCSLLSMIRNLKAGFFAKRCGVCILLKWLLILLKKILIGLWRFCKAIGRGLARWGKTLASAREITFTLIQIGALLFYTIVTVVIVAFAAEEGAGILLFLLPIYGFGGFLIARKGEDLEEIKKGAARIRNGDLSHQVPAPKATYFKALAEDINHIAKGLDNSLSARMKAERMKTELITNVSHDLKTPLTSIITYTELLSRVEGLPEEAEDYIRIIGDKSQRLKSLTQDLFDISKVQSGNEEVCWEVLDAALLLEQSLAEETGEASMEALPFCLKTSENLSFMGDGRKLSRVLGNLIQNATKYAMSGTRIFLSAYEQEDRVIIECKNTSAYPLDFAPEEILGRFVRGDSSRSTEGNGLGLPIAKSYTELCGGEFRLVLDGDLFKVLLSFPKAQ